MKNTEITPTVVNYRWKNRQ